MTLVTAYLGRFDREEMISASLLGIIAGIVAMIALDLGEMYAAHGAVDPMATAGTVRVVPDLPVETEVRRPVPAATPRERFFESEALRQKLSFSLGPVGVLEVEGNIDAGAASRFAAELQKHGEAIETLSLNSPGGSLADAMAMARQAREAGLSTRVPAGATCASSCPLLLAGGISRSVGSGAMIGLHQFYALEPTSGPAEAMSDAQLTTAAISRYLAEMGVDPALWLHALETPPHALYFLSDEELTGYGLVTTAGGRQRDALSAVGAGANGPSEPDRRLAYRD